MSTTTATGTEIPASRRESDPDRVAHAEPQGHISGVPVYGWGLAPLYLRTETQLAADRLNVTEEHEKAPLAYIRTRDYGDVPLHAPGKACWGVRSAGPCPRCVDAPRPFPQRMRKHVGWLSASCEDASVSQAEDICSFSCVRVAVPS
ncbi:hypothetical protein ACFVWP_38860 [Streptomyces sp. NPDC058175]|uniref:hypothetical protein n=1 Tax=Streptomyces sp. NPDC058175 TaxID=3346367 RepID=UPI0036E77698